MGNEGCSSILGIGFIETDQPSVIRQTIADLHDQVAGDKYLQSIPSIIKTNRAFHAKDDAPEVRYLVYQTLAKLDFKAQFVIARKIERVFRNSFDAKETKFYDHLVSQLFTNVLHRHIQNHVYFSQRGSKTRQANLEQAISSGIEKFEARWAMKVDTKTRVIPQTTVGEPCLQVIDYMNWAVYRAFVKREMRYFDFIADKVSFLVDLYDLQNYPHNWYSRENPFDIEKVSPL
ncbi:MAG: hypothetical protein AABZ00_10135 [Chloroflexota bacterium]